MSRDILHYLRQIYLPVIDQFVVFATRRNRNFDIKATSWAESSQAAVKKQLRNRNGDLVTLYTAIKHMRESEIEKHRHTVNDQPYKGISKTRENLWFRGVRVRITQVASQQLLNHETEALEALRDPNGKDFNCTGQYRIPYWLDHLNISRKKVIYNFDLLICTGI